MASNTRAKVKDLAATKKSNRETFRRRKLNFLKRGNDISAAFQADVYILVSWNGKFFTYKSTDRPSWPPAEDEMARGNLYQKTPADFSSSSGRRRRVQESQLADNATSSRPITLVRFPTPPQMEELSI